ncbi:MAG: hypothetical protein JW732_06220 [Dehalococcoidia bacterium]|nr:hypothetical protein [Dehalococcoidia bacterium]
MKEHRLQILPIGGRLSYVLARVEVHERMDGILAVYCPRTMPGYQTSTAVGSSAQGEE